MAVIGGFDAMSLENSGFLSESKRSHTLRGGLYVLAGRYRCSLQEWIMLKQTSYI